jgi:hypothetical protein
MFLLDLACQPISEAFGHGVFHVGTSASGREGFRDVDVRLILSDKKHDRLRKAVGTRGIAFMGLAFGQYVASLTDLPIDFQIQRQTEANHHHPNKFRNPLGMRTLDNFVGDAPRIEPHGSGSGELDG